MLAVVILLVGMFKIPAPFLGADFQLSAPIAILICASFGFKRYILAGLLASILGLLLGVHNLYSVVVQLVFRLVAGGVLTLLGTNIFTLGMSGPLGTLAARFVLAQITGISWLTLSIAALPGICFTAILSIALYKPLRKLLARTPLKSLCHERKLS